MSFTAFTDTHMLTTIDKCGTFAHKHCSQRFIVRYLPLDQLT